MINIVLADEYPLIIEGFKSITDDSTMQLVNTASSMDELYSVLQQTQPDIILMDITITEANSFESLKELKEAHPEIPVLILSGHPVQKYAIRSIQSGAHGYLNKKVSPDRLTEAIKTVVNEGRKYITPEVAEIIAEDLNFNGDKPRFMHELLSFREEQIMLLIAKGYKVNDIAEKLYLSPHTIHTYRSRILKKLNMNSNTEITHYALTHELID